MRGFNSITLMGNLTRDPQLKQLPSGTDCCDCGIAVNRKWKTAEGEEREEVCFVDFSAFGNQAVTLNEYCHKGDGLLINGRLKLDSWEDQQGNKRSKLSVVVENFVFVGGGGNRQNGGGGGNERNDDQRQPAPREERRPQQQPQQRTSAPPRGRQQQKAGGGGFGGGADIPF